MIHFISIVLVISLNVVQGRLTIDLEREKLELLRLHKSDREAHFTTDVEMLQRNAPEEFITVTGGNIYRIKNSDERKQFAEYFKGAKYHEWDDLEEPIIRVSNDGSMAWMITRLKVRRTQKSSAGAEKEEKFTYAGIMTYEKRNGKWIRMANVSTFASRN